MADLTKTLELKVETSQAQKQISDVIEEIKNPVELKIDADVKEAVSSIKELQNIFKALTNQTKDGQTLRINVNGIVNVQKQLSKLSDTLTEVSNKISFDNIRPPKAVEANIDVVNKQLEVVKQNADAIKKAEKYLAGPKVENLMTEMMANDGKKDINFDDLGAKNYIKRAKQLVNLGGDLSKISFNLEWFTTDENKKSIKHSGIFTALDVLEKLQAVGGFKLQDIIDTSNGNVIGTDIDNLTSKLKDLDYELQQAKAKQGREFTVGLDESSIEKITQAVEKLNAVIGDTDGKTLGIDEASLTKIVSAIESIKESFNGIKFDESATLGFKPDQIDAITNSFRDLQDVLEDIHSLLSSLDIPKIDGSNITTERRPRRENHQTKTVSKTVPTADGGTRTVTNTKDNSVTTGGTKGIQIDPDVTEFVKKVQEQINGEHVEIDVEPKPISGFADKIKQAVGNVEIEITPVVGQKEININASLKDLMSRMNAYMQNNAVKGSYDYWKYLSDNFATLDSQTKQLVSDLGLLNEAGNGIKLIDNGGNNQGGIIGEQNVLLSRNATEDKYNALLRLKGLLDQATEAGVQCSNILDITFDKNTGKMFELQKTLSGDPISNLGLVGDGKKAKFNTAVFEATDKQIQKLIKDIEILSKLGIGIDFNDSNFLFDKKNGFSFIDLDLLPEGFSSDYWKEELVPMFDYISDEFNNPELTKQIEQFKTRLQNAINSPTSAENEYTVEIHADTGKLRGEIESSLEAPFEAKIEPDTSILRQNIEQDLTTPFKIEIQPSDTLVDTINKMLASNGAFNIDVGVSKDDVAAQTQSTFGKNPYQMIYDMVSADEWMRKNLINPYLPTKDKEVTELLKERMMAFSSKTGEHTNPYIFDKHSSTQFGQLLDKDPRSKQGIFDTYVHTHPESFAHMSIANHDKKTNRYSGDLAAYKWTLDNNYKIGKQIIATQKDVQLFDAEQFFKDNEHLFKDNATTQNTLKKFSKISRAHLLDFQDSITTSMEIIDYVNKFGDGFALNFDSISSIPSFLKNGNKIDLSKRFSNYVKTWKENGDYDDSTNLKTAILDFLTETISQNGNTDPAHVRQAISKGFEEKGSDDTNWYNFLWDNFIGENNGQRMQDITDRTSTRKAWEIMGVDWDKYNTYMPIEDFKKQFAGAIQDNGGVDMSQLMGQPFKVNVNFDDAPDKLREAIDGGAPYEVKVSTDSSAMQQIIQGGIDAGSPYNVDSFQLGADIQLAEKIQENISSGEYFVNPKLDPSSDLVQSIQNALNNAELIVNVKSDNASDTKDQSPISNGGTPAQTERQVTRVQGAAYQNFKKDYFGDTFLNDAKWDYEMSKIIEDGTRLDDALNAIFNENPGSTLQTVIDTVQEELNNATTKAQEFDSILKEIRTGTKTWSFNDMLNDPEGFAADLNKLSDSLIHLREAGSGDTKEALNIETRMQYMLAAQHKIFEQKNKDAFKPYFDRVQSNLTEETQHIQDEMWDAMANGGNLTSRNDLPDLVSDRLKLGFSQFLNNADIDNLSRTLNILQNIEAIHHRMSNEGQTTFYESQVRNSLEIARDLENRLRSTPEDEKKDDPEWVENQYRYIAQYLQKAEEYKKKIADIKGEVYEMQQFTADSVKSQILSGETSVPEDVMRQAYTDEYAASAERAADAQRKAAEAAKEHMEQAELANRAEADQQGLTGGTYTPSSSAISEDVEALSGLVEKLSLVTQAVDEKTNAFRAEGEVVTGTVQEEITMLTALEGWITMISQDLDKLSDGLKTLPEIDLKIKTDENGSVFGKDLTDGLERIKEVLRDLNPDAVSAFDNMLKNISFDASSVTNLNNLTEAISRLVDKIKELNENDFSDTPLSSINDLLQNADALKDLAKILESSAEKIKAASKIQKPTSKYDDTEMKRRAGEIQKKVDETVDGADKEALVSIERMYDSHNNLVQAILTTKKKVQDSKTGKELDQIEKFNIHWNKAGNDVWASRMTKDEYDKSQKEYERYLKEQMSVYERLTKEQAKRENMGSGLTEAESKQLESAKTIIAEINDLKAKGLKLTEAQEEAVTRATAADQKAAQIRQDYADKQNARDKDKQDREDAKAAQIKAKEQEKKAREDAKATRDATKDQLEEYFETIKNAENARTRLNEAVADSYNGNTSIEDVKALRNEVEQTGDAAEKAKEKITGLLDDENSGLTNREVEQYRKRLEDQYGKSLFGSDSSLKKLQKVQRKQFESETKNDLYDYLNSRQTYQKLYAKSLGGQNTYDDNGRLVSSSALSADEILQINNALTTIVAQEQNWNSAKVQGITLTQKQAEAVKLLRDASQQMNEDGSFNENYTKDMLEQSAMQQKAMVEYSKLEKQISKMYDQTEWRANSADWEKQVGTLEESLKNIGATIGEIDSKEGLDAVLGKIKELAASRQELSKNTDWMPIADDTKASLKTGLLKWMDQNKRAANEYHEELQQIIEDIDKIGSKGDAEQISSRIQGVQGKAIEEGFAGKSLGDRFRDQFSNTMTSLATYYLSFQDFIRYGRQAISVVRELDTALTEVRKVSSESLGSLRDWQVSTFDQANTVGGSAKQLQESTASWLRLGKSFEESQEAAQASVKLLNVSEFTNIDDATTSLVSMKQAFKDLTYDDFIDKLNGVGDNFSSSTDQLAYGMQNVSSVLKVAGNDIDQSLALLTAANDVTQDMSKASMGVRTIALRMSGTEEAKQELEEMGEDTSDFIVQTQSKVDEQVRKYTATAANPEGISVLDDNGRLRSTYDVLLDISKVYGEIVEKDNEHGTNTSNALLELLAGKTRSNILASILQNPDLLEASYKQSQNSQGIGQKELDVYLDSVEAHIARLQNRLQELAYVSINSDSLKTLIDLLTLAVQAATALSKALGGINLIIGAAFTAFAKIKKNGPSLLDYDSKKGFSGTLIDIFGNQKQPSSSTGGESAKNNAQNVAQDAADKISQEKAKAKLKIDVEPEAKVDEQATKQAAQDASDKVQEQAEKTATPVMTPGKVDAKEATEEAKQAMEEAKEQVESEPTTMSPEITVDGAKVNAEPLKQQVQEKVNEAKAEAEENVDFSDTPDGTGTRRGGIGYKIGGAKEYVEQKIGKGKGGRKAKKDQAREERSAKKQARDEANQAKFKKQEESTEATAQNIDQASEAEQQFAENAEKAQEAAQQVNDAAEQTAPAVQQAASDTKEMASGFEQAAADAKGAADETRNVASAAAGATEGVGKMGQIFDKLKGGLKNIGGQFLSIATNMAIATAASMAITGIMKAIKYIAEYDENIIQKGREAQATIADINKAYDETESKTKDLGKRYNELRAGVAYTPDGNGISNIKLSEEEYAEFLDINNQLASLYPELVSGQDAQGNSLVDLGTNAKSATDKLNEYLNVQREIANYDIAANMQDAVNGVVKQNEQFQTELDNMTEEAERYENAIGQYQFAEPERPWWLDNETSMETVEIDWFDKDTRTKLHNAIEQVQTETGAQISEMGFDDEFFKTDEFGNQVRKYQVAVQGTEEEVKSATEQLSEFFSTAIRGLEDEHEQATNKMKISEKQIADNWASLAPSLASSIKTGKTYKDLVGVSPEIEEAFSRMLNNVDYGNIFEHADAVQRANFVPYLRDMLVYSFDAAIDGASDKDQMQKNIEDLLTFDSSKMDTQTLKDNLNSLLDDIFGDDEELKQNIRIALGFTFVDDDGEKWKADELDSKIKDIVSTRKGGKVFARYASVALNQEDKATLEKMEKNGAFDIDLTKAKNGTEALDMIIEKIKEYRDQKQEIEKTGGLGDIFAKETYQTNVGEYQERLSSLTSAMSALRDEGNLTAETMKELQEQFPDMTDFSEAGMQKYASNQLNKWISEFSEGWTDFSADGIEQLDTYLQNLITSYKDVSVSAEEARSATVKYLESSINADKSEVSSIATRIYQSNIEALEQSKYGKNINWNIVMALQGEMGRISPEEFVQKYGEYEAHWTIMVTNAEEIENLANKLTDLQTQQSEIEDGISYRENRGLKKTVKQYSDLLDNSKEQVKTIREQNKLTREQQKQLVKINGEAYKTTNAYRNMQSQIDSNNATIRSLAESQREYQMQAGTIATQNIIDTISSLKQTLSEGGLGSETLYNLIKDMPNASDALFHTSSGQFVDTQKMNELVQEQGDFAIAIAETQQAAEALKLQKNEKDMERMSKVTGIATNDVEALQAALKEDPGDFYLNKYMDLHESNQNIRDTILNLETLQQELRQAQSDFGQYQLAQSSWNPSDNMQTIRSGMEGAMKLFKDGWLGKDDFTTFAKLLATDEEIANGTFIDNFEENYQKRQRYLTENAEGVHRWYDDIIAKNEELSENWVDIDGNIHVDNMKEFAKQMGVSQEFAETMLMAMKDAAYDVDLSIIGDEFANNFKDIDFTANNARGQVKNLITEMNNLSDAGVDVSGGAEAAADAIQQLALKGHDVSGLVDQLNTIGLDNGFHIDPTTFEVTTVVNNEELEKTKSEAEQGANMPIKARLQQGAKNALETLGANIKTEIEARQIEKQTAPITDGLGNVESAVGDLGGNIDAAASSIVGAITGQNPDGTTNGTKNSPTTGGFNTVLPEPSKSPQIPSFNQVAQGVTQGMMPSMDSDTIQKTVQYTAEDSEIQSKDKEIESQNLEQQVDITYNEKNPFRATTEEKVVKVKTESDGKNTTPGDTISTHHFEGDESGLKKEAEEAKKDVDNVPGKKNVVFQGIDQASSVANRVKNAISGVTGKAVEIVAKTTGLDRLQSVKNLIDNIRSKTVNVVTNVVKRISGAIKNGIGEAIGTAHVSYATGTAYASGTAYDMWEDYRHSKHAWAKGTPQDWELPQDEEALVNEVGTESIVRDGRWFEIPGNAHVEQLKRGDILFSAKQTEELKKYGKVYSGGGHGKIAYANGTAYNMINARVKANTKANVSPNKYVQMSRQNVGMSSSSTTKSNTSAVKSNTSATKTATKSTNKNTGSLDAFKQWLEKFVDWIEVRINRVSESIDNLSQISENLAGYAKKNAEVNKAMSLTGLGTEQYSLKTSKDADGVQRVSGITYSGSQKGTQIDNNLRGAERYFKFAEEIRTQAIKNGLVNATQAADIVGKIQSGAIDIKSYEEKQREFISSYQEW